MFKPLPLVKKNYKKQNNSLTKSCTCRSQFWHIWLNRILIKQSFLVVSGKSFLSLAIYKDKKNKATESGSGAKGWKRMDSHVDGRSRGSGRWRNWLNQSFIPFSDQYAVRWLGSERQAGVTLPYPPLTQTHVPIRSSLSEPASLGKGLWLQLAHRKHVSPRNSYRSGGTLPRWFLNVNTPKMGPLCGIVICRRIPPARVALDAGCYPERKSKAKRSTFVKRSPRFCEPRARREIYGGPGCGYLGGGNTGYKSQPPWRPRPLVEEERHKCSWVGVIQPDWMSASWTPGEGNGTSIIQQRDGGNLWQKLQRIDHE